MILSLPPALLFAVFFFSENYVAARSGPKALPRRYLNTSASTSIPSTFTTVSPTILSFDEASAAPQLFTPVDGTPALRPSTSPSDTSDDEKKPQDSASPDSKPDTPNTPTFIPPPLSYSIDPTNYSSRPTYSNVSIPISASNTLPPITSCITRKPDEGSTVYVILPNPTTVTVTLGGNYTTSLRPQEPEFTPPTFCPEPVLTTLTTSRPRPSFNPPVTTTKRRTTQPKSIATSVPVFNEPMLSSIPFPYFSHPPIFPVQPPTTIVTTSKNPVTVFSSSAPPRFPGGDVPAADKQSVDPNVGNGGPAYVPPSYEGAPAGNPAQSNQEPSNQNPPGAFPIMTTVQGIPVQIEPSYAIVRGITYSYPNPTQSAQAQPPAGAPGSEITAAIPTNVVIIDGGIFLAIGPSVAVFDGQTIRYDGVSAITTVFHRETITLGSSISFDGTTIGGPANSGTQVGIAGGISVTQLGQSIGVISSTSFTIGPQAVITTVIIDTYTIVANPSGLVVAGTTLYYPFNPVTQVLTIGDLILTQIGTSLLVVGGSTYTIATSFNPIGTSVNNRQTISINTKSQIATTTTVSPQSVPVSAPPTATSKKSEAKALQPMYFILGIFVTLCVGVAI